MTEETLQSTQSETKSYAIGQRLKSARESLGMDTKDVAARLRLHEDVISMLEKDETPNNLPTIFIRGYIRAYGKFLELPDYEIKQALAPIEVPVKDTPAPEVVKAAKPKIRKSFLMRVVNIAIAFTLISLVWQWWHTHSTASIMIGDKNLAIPFDNGVLSDVQSTANTLTIQQPVHTGNPTSAVTIQIPLAPQIDRALSSNSTKPVANSDSSSVATTQPPLAPTTIASNQDAIATPQKKSVVITNNTSNDEYDNDDTE